MIYKPGRDRLSMRKDYVIPIGLVLIAFLVSIYLYPQLPERIASHWNAAGQVDGYTSKIAGLFFIPVLMALLLLLFTAIPRLDPMKHNISKFARHYNIFIIIMIAFMFYLDLLTLSWNLGYSFNMITMLVPAFAILFYYCGILTENAKMNWFIGIRTPWTLSSEKVWTKTNQRGGRLFKVAGVISLVGLVFQPIAIIFVILPAILIAVYTVAYSYFEYKKTLRKKK
jgi:uncharacterized membrane protein